MSLLMTLTHEAGSVLLAGPPIPTQDGIFDTIDSINLSALTSVRGLSITVAVIFIVVTMIRTKMAMTAVLVAGLTAALGLWIVFNVTDVQDRVDTELNAAAVPLLTSPHPNSPVRFSPAL